VLAEILGYAVEHRVDGLLVAGDIFDTAAPLPESEELVYQFFGELYGAGIPALIIGGNHDHPRRLDAVAGVLHPLRIHLRGTPVVGERGVVEIASRDGREAATVALLPWVQERQVLDFERLHEEAGQRIAHYADQVTDALRFVCRGLRPGGVNLLMAHLLVDEAVVGQGGGERQLHVSMGIYGVPRQSLPPVAQYVALGHVHKPQAVWDSPAAWYPGSPLQLDFGEREQDKFVNLVEVHAGVPAEVTQLPLRAGRRLVDLGTPGRGVPSAELARYAAEAGDAWLRVFVEVEAPLANLAAYVRESLPNAVDVIRAGAAAHAPQRESLAGLGPVELFSTFYRSPQGRGQEPTPQVLGLFRDLLEEEGRETAQA
jgi:exonuclease SbcD